MGEKGEIDHLSYQLLSELSFSYSKSSGPGGQHVNKVNTRVELKFNVLLSEFLSSEQKNRITDKLKNRISTDGILTLYSQKERSQIRNKQSVIEKFTSLIRQALTPEKKRTPTKPTSSSIMKRLDEKRRKSEIKQIRKKPDEI